MATPDVKTVFEDPEFQALPAEERRKVLSSIDSDFLALAVAEQDKVLGSVSPSLPTSPVATPGIRPPTAEELFARRYTREQQRPALEKAIGLGGQALSVIPSLIETAVKGAQGLGAVSGGSLNPITARANIEQTGLEAGGRLAFDIANLIRQGGRAAIEQPGTVATALIPGVGPMLALRSKTPSTEEISSAFQRELANQEAARFRESAPIVPEIIGKANIPLAEALPLALGGEGALARAPRVLAAAKTIPLVEGTARVGGAVARAISGGARGVVEKFIPQPLVKNIITALDPRANAINPAKTVKAMKDAELAVKRILPEITPEDLAHPQTLADNATLKLQDIHAKREVLAGAPIQISLDPLADAYVKLASDPALKVAKPQSISQLEARARELRGKTLSGSDAERLNQYLNAENSTLYVKTGVERSKALKADPMLAAGEDAAQALRKQLDAGFGAEFGELGKDYGAWRNITELAQKQAVKQAKIEGRLGLYEGLSALQAISSSGEPLRAALSLAGGQVLKYVGSPVARFESAAARLAEEIKKGNIPQPRTVLPPQTPPTPPGTVTTGPGGPVINQADLEAFIRQSLRTTPPE